MDIHEYFAMFSEEFGRANSVASESRKKGRDPELFPEIKAAPSLADRVEGIIGIEGLADIIKNSGADKQRQELAFETAREVCTNKKFEQEPGKRILLAVRAGLSILTEGILVAPTEGIQDVKLYKNLDGTSYAAIVFAGPIRSAGGTSAALAAALADYSRKLLGIDRYKPSGTEVERYLEEIHIYNSRVARLQYLPKDEDIRVIIENCEVCVDGIPIGDIEVSIRKNLKRTNLSGKQELVTNKIRSGIGLVICEGIAQKAKSVLKHAKNAGLNWSWLNSIIKVDKETVQVQKANDKFLEDIAAGRPILAYPEHYGSFRLRYGRCRFSGIASKAVHPATMAITNDFLAVGTQMRIDKPGKGCIAVPADSIEGPFVKLDDGHALRIKTAAEANEAKGRIKKILSLGDILVTFGDFKKTNTLLQPTSYVEEYWAEQLAAANADGKDIEAAKKMNEGSPDFETCYELSKKYCIPMHPRYIYDYSCLSMQELNCLFEDIAACKELDKKNIFNISEIRINSARSAFALEKMCIEHFEEGGGITIKNDDARALLCSLGLVKNTEVAIGGEKFAEFKAAAQKDTILEALNTVAPFTIMNRSTRIGARIGRPEKAKQRMMKPAPNGLFPIGAYGGKERNISKAYDISKKKLDSKNISLEIARFMCGGKSLPSFYCAEHGRRAGIERVCSSCNRISYSAVCKHCGAETTASGIVNIDLAGAYESAIRDLGLGELGMLPKNVKGISGLVNKNKIPEPIEKAMLRALHKVFVFKDGTCRFDATDVPITHFYPDEISCSVERLRQMGYLKDSDGNDLRDGSQLVEMFHQDILINRKGAEYLLDIAKFIDDLLVRYYKMQAFYNAKTIDDLIGHFAITLSPHTSCGVLSRIIGFTDANVGFAHPYMISARRRNADGDEDSTMLLLDGLMNFSKSYLPSSIGGTMDAPLILTINILPEEVDDEVWNMEVTNSYGLDFYNRTMNFSSPSEAAVECVNNRLGSDAIYRNLKFTHNSSITAVADSPKKSIYTILKTMKEKVDAEFELMDMLYSVDKTDAAQKLIMSHFIPDLIGNLHSFSKQMFRCTKCNAKYRRIPLKGKCQKCDGRLTFTISRGGIEKYLNLAISLADRYHVADYIKQRLVLIKNEINVTFGDAGAGAIGDGAGEQRNEKQMNLLNFL
ncbi:MAG: DNA polymerase II large subunit [Candidatus Marsarchaeota archaeon]|nr:DNA polymerase II large subunit [Candidatus Marsarchaeota archaeon]